MTGRVSVFLPGAAARKLRFSFTPVLPGSCHPWFVSRLRSWLASALAVLVPLAGIGAGPAGWPGQYSVREWHTQDGLPSDDVTRVQQDRSGYLWLATSRGLTRFDGVYFETFGPELAQLGSPGTMRAIVETEQLGLVLAPSSGGTLAYKGGVFRRLEFARDKQVNSLFAEPDGTLWASCEDRTVLRLHAGQVESFVPSPDETNRFLAFFAQDREQRVWIASGTYLGRYENGRLVRLNPEPGGTDYRVAAGRDGHPWVLTRDRLMKLEDGRLRPVLDLPPLAGAHYAMSVLEDRTGTLWIGTRSQGLYAVRQGQCQAIPTSGESVFSLCEDTEGDIWAATNGGGLNRLRFRDFRLYDQAAGLGDNFSHTVSEDESGTIWLGNRDGGVARVRAGQVEVLPAIPDGLQSSVVSVVPDGAGRVWVTNGAGVFRLDPAAHDEFVRVEAIPVRPIIRVAFVARNGDYWVGLDPDRIGRYRQGKFETFGHAEGFDGKGVRCFAEDEQGRILIGTTDGQMIRYDGRQFTSLLLEVEGAADAPVQAIYPEPGGITWLGTSGNGLYAYADGRCRQITTLHGLLDIAITAIVPDDHGYLWFGSSLGIFSLRRQELAEFLNGTVSRVHPVIVGRDDGVRGLACLGLYKPAAWKSHDGRLWFATRKGVLNFDPSAAITDVAAPPVLVAGVKCDDERRSFSGPLEVSARVRKLEFRFSVLCLSTPDRVQIKYRLDGFDSQWITAGPDRTVTYPRLPPGQYRLRAMASLGNGVWNEGGPVLALTVTPLWWQTLWFQLLSAAAGVFLVVFIVRTVSHRRLRLRLERLEHESAIERERTRIARNIHDDLGASLTRISLLTQAAKRDEAAASTPQLNQIYETVRQITRSMDEIVWAVNPKNDHLDGLATYLVSYAQGFLSVAGIRCRLDLPDHLPVVAVTSQTRHNLYLCLKEALNNVVKHSGADEVTVAMRAAGGKFTLTITDNGRQPSRPGPNGANGHGAHRELRVSSGHGLSNIALRVAEMGGTYDFAPAQGDQGARLTVVIALGPQPADKSAPASRRS